MHLSVNDCLCVRSLMEVHCLYKVAIFQTNFIFISSEFDFTSLN